MPQLPHLQPWLQKWSAGILSQGYRCCLENSCNLKPLIAGICLAETSESAQLSEINLDAWTPQNKSKAASCLIYGNASTLLF